MPPADLESLFPAWQLLPHSNTHRSLGLSAIGYYNTFCKQFDFKEFTRRPSILCATDVQLENY